MGDSNPNFSKAYCAANEILVKSSLISNFPFDAISLVRDESDISFCSFSRAKEKYSLNMIDFGSKSAIIFEYAGMHIIFCNDSHVENRQRWSIIHEFGHYVLNHKMNVSKNDPLYKNQEIEANCFAAQILMPEQIIRQFEKRGKGITVEFLKNSFKVTDDAADKRIITMQNYQSEWHSRRECEYDDIIIQKFSSFTNKIAPFPKNYFDFEEEFELENERSKWSF